VEVIEAIKTRRSIRQYLPDDVSEDDLEAVLEAARWSPSWANTQCARFVVVREKDIKIKLAASLHTGNPAIEAMNQAPTIIVVCAELGKSGFHGGGNVTNRDDWKVSITGKGDWYMFDTALAMQSMALAAHAVGLGTVFIGGFNPWEVAKILNVPRGVEVVAMTPLGYPAKGTKQSSRCDLSEIVFRDNYGKRFI
jgi:nitroreductase